jgi:protein-disulfide isomerase
MLVSRRSLLSFGGLIVATGASTGLLSWPALAADMPAISPAVAAKDPRMADRALGRADAPVTVDEWYSMTCPHCATFQAEILPQIRTGLIDTGKLRYVFHDFPLDQLALTAAMVARSLPPDRYEPFVGALLASQMRWAYARDVNPTDELAKMAALAGMSRATFDKVIADQTLRAEILSLQSEAENFYHIDSTPSFIFNGPAEKNHLEAGEQSYDAFVKLVAAAAG